MIAVTHKEMVIRFWHVTHPLAITGANELIQRAAGQHVGLVGGWRGEKREEVRRGLGCERRD